MRIETKERIESYGRMLTSANVVVDGDRVVTINVVPRGESGRQVDQGPLVPGPWGFATPHPVCLSAHGGGTADDIAAAPYRVAFGEVFSVQGLPGRWTFRRPGFCEGSGPILAKVEAMLPGGSGPRAQAARRKARREGAFRIWVNTPRPETCGYLALASWSNSPAEKQTTSSFKLGAAFATRGDALAAIKKRGWIEDTNVRPGQITAYLVEGR